MTTKQHYIEVGGLQVEVVRKSIKNLHLAVYPPEGRVRVAVPLAVDDEAVRLAVISKLGWIKRKQEAFAKQPRQSQRDMVTGESHYFQGRRYRLKIVEGSGANKIYISGKNIILHIKPGTERDRREEILTHWYRQQLKEMIPELLTKWEPVVGAKTLDWGVKKMKTRWGSCNSQARRIWLNLELAKKPLSCLEYVLVHELVHLHERRHNDHFRKLMDQFMPQWRNQRDLLNSAPLGHEEWGY